MIISTKTIIEKDNELINIIAKSKKGSKNYLRAVKDYEIFLGLKWLKIGGDNNEAEGKDEKGNNKRNKSRTKIKSK